ncbi:SDR family oxidoreductase [Corynebacterium callunae]|uniref:SDR family oxidoreductase n=1 Tax=Corynebacterium callunae TaxID=1721 RepID=UPI0039819A42
MKSIFISGAAQKIGKAVALKFLAEGWRVDAHDIAPIEYEHSNLHKGHLDIANADEWESALADFAAVAGGTIDVVDNNAGIIIDGPLAKAKEGDVEKLIAVNVTGVTLGARAAHAYLARTPGAHLVNMASASAVYGQPNIAVYSASKFYVAGLTEALELEWHHDDIRIVDLWPLWAKTTLAQLKAASTRRLGVRITPEQVAEAVWGAVNPGNRWARGKVHHGVLTLDKALYVAKSLAPDRLARLLIKIVAG